MDTLVGLAGDLEDFAPQEVLEFLATTAQTGRLCFGPDAAASLWFCDGGVEAGEPAGAGAVGGAATSPTDDEERRERAVGAVFELLLLRAGTFAFHPRPGGEQGRDPLPAWPLAEVMAQAAGRIERWRDIAASVPSTAAVASPAASLPLGADGITLSPLEWRTVVALDGRRSVAEVIALVGASAFEVCAALHALVTAGAVSVAPPPDAS